MLGEQQREEELRVRAHHALDWCEQGTSSGLDIHAQCFRCEPEAACLGNNTCAEGHTGFLCGSCVSGFTRFSAHELCGTCPSPLSNAAILLAYGLGIVALAFLLVGVASQARRSNDVLVSLPQVTFKIMSGFLVTLSAINPSIQLHVLLGQAGVFFPPMAKALLGSGDFIAKPASVWVSVKCIFPYLASFDREAMSVIVSLLLIPSILLLLLVCTVIRQLCRMMCRRRHQRGRISGTTLCSQVLRDFEPAAVVVLHFLHPMVTERFLNTFDCAESDKMGLPFDEPRLVTDMDIECWNWMEGGRISYHELASLCGILLWSIGIPLCLFLALLWQRRRGEDVLYSHEVRRKFGFMINSYKREHFAYECTLMARRVVFLTIAAPSWYVNDESRALLLLGLTSWFLAVQNIKQPFLSIAYNRPDLRMP